MSSLAINPVNHAAQHRLANEIYGVLEAYNYTSYNKRYDQPPFTAGELAVMAAIYRMSPVSTAVEMLKWICHNFSFYGREAIELLGNGNAFSELIPGFLEALLRVGLPLSAVTDNPQQPRQLPQVTYTPDINACRIFLRKYIVPATHRPFRLMDLPRELRLTIFELALGLPPIRRPAYEEPDRISLAQKEHEDDHEPSGLAFGIYSYEPTHILFQRMCHWKTIYELLALLFVNKQIYAEAKPAFYQVNHFALEFGADFNDFVRGIAPSRLQYLGHLDIDYKYTPAKESKRTIPALEALMKIANLRSVTVKTEDEAWFKLVKSGVNPNAAQPKKRFESPADFPAIFLFVKLLAKASVLNFESKEGCERIESFVRAEVAKMKAGLEIGHEDGGKVKIGAKRKRVVKAKQ